MPAGGCGAALNTRRCICGPTKASATPALRSAATWTFIMADVHTRALTAKHQITPTSRYCLPAWQPNPGRGSTYRSDKNCSDNRLQLCPGYRTSTPLRPMHRCGHKGATIKHPGGPVGTLGVDVTQSMTMFGVGRGDFSEVVRGAPFPSLRIERRAVHYAA